MLERESGVKKNKERPWRERDHSLFVGYAPVDQPLCRLCRCRARRWRIKDGRAYCPDVLKEVQRVYAPGQWRIERLTDEQPRNLNPTVMTLGQRFWQLNWFLILLICALASVGFMMLYSQAMAVTRPGPNGKWCGLASVCS